MISYRQKNKSRIWNLVNKLKRLQLVGCSLGFSVPHTWLKAMNWERGNDFFLMTLDSANERIVIKKINKEDYELEKTD